MLTFLHHSDPTIPHYRAGQWTFLRGALATVDRPLLGFIGRMYFHNVICSGTTAIESVLTRFKGLARPHRPPPLYVHTIL